VNERWVCKRCFADNDETVAACHRCGLIRGAESTDADQTAWAASPQPEAVAGGKRGGGVLRQLLRFWWIPAAAIALAVGYFSTAQRGEDGSLSTAGNVSVTDLQVGDCFNAAEFSEEDVEVDEVNGVPCDEPHAFEVYEVADYTGSAYPGTDAAFETAFAEVCIPPFESYVGVPYESSVLFASAITPTEEGWNSGDHEFICHLHEEDATMISGSQQGANR
jgi:Septum formation